MTSTTTDTGDLLCRPTRPDQLDRARQLARLQARVSSPSWWAIIAFALGYGLIGIGATTITSGWLASSLLELFVGFILGPLTGSILQGESVRRRQERLQEQSDHYQLLCAADIRALATQQNPGGAIADQAKFDWFESLVADHWVTQAQRHGSQW